MLSAVSLVLLLLRHYLLVFDQIFGMAMNFVFFFIQATLIKTVNTPLDKSAALILSVLNRTHCSCTDIWQILLEIWLELDMAGFPKNVWIPD